MCHIMYEALPKRPFKGLRLKAFIMVCVCETEREREREEEKDRE